MSNIPFFMKRLALLLFIASLTFSCDEKPMPEPTPEPTPERLPIKISTTITRATETEFEQGDQVGVYVVNEPASLQTTGNHVDNMRFTYSGNWEPDTPIYWKDKTTKADFYCYYPYETNISNIEAYYFPIKADQTSETNYKACDFLWGAAKGMSPTEDAIGITAKHLMSSIIIRLIAGNGYREEDMRNATVTICGLKTGSYINLTNGVVTPDGDSEDIHPLSENEIRRAIVVPQNVTDTDIVKVSIEDKTYTLNQSVTFETGKQHTCTLTVEKTNQGINIGIGGWESADEDFGGTVE